MMGKPVQRVAKLFHIGFDLNDRVPADHPLRRVEAAIDFSFVRRVVAEAYGNNGHVSLDPTVVLKLLFLCFFENVRSERELLRELPLRLDWLWFCGMTLDDEIPDHSVLSKARTRWGQERFEAIFQEVVHRCQEAGLVGNKTLHADSTLLRANASLDKRVPRKLWQQLEAARLKDTPASQEHDQGDPPDHGQTPSTAKAARPRLNDRVVSPVDPDAATSTRKVGGTTLGFRDHRMVDDHCGIIVTTVATAADRDDGAMLPELLDRQETTTGRRAREVVGDSMYGTQSNYHMLEERAIKAYLKKRRGKDSPKISWLELLPENCSPDRARALMLRRRTCAEGRFAEAHVRMNHRRCRWRRLWRVQIQCYLVATVQNIKKLAQVRRKSPAATRAMQALCLRALHLVRTFGGIANDPLLTLNEG